MQTKSVQYQSRQLRPSMVHALSSVLLLGLVASASAFAQDVQEEQCFFFPTSSESVVPDNWGSGLRLVSPRQSAGEVPLNTRLVLAGNLFDLDDGCEVLRLRSEDGDDVELIREGDIVRPANLLQASTEYFFSTDHCFSPNEGQYRFTTGERIDDAPPALSDAQRDALVSHVFLHPDCGGTFTTSVFVGVLRLPAQLERLRVNVQVAGSAIQGPLDIFASDEPFAYRRVGLNILAQQSEPFRVSVSPVNYAGIEGEAVIYRLNARRSSEGIVVEDRQLYSVESNACVLENTLSVEEQTPINGVVQLRYPLEAAVYFLENDTRQVPLLVDDDLSFAQRLRPAENVAAGESFNLVRAPCSSCVCEGCQQDDDLRVTFVEADNDTPEVPEVLEILEDLEPPPSVGQCQEDRSALLVRLAPSGDKSLRYRVSIRLENVLPVQAGSNLIAVEQPDGTRLLRLETAEYGRLLPLAFELTLEVKDAADNQNLVRHQYAPPAFVEESGCSNVNAAPAMAALFFVTLLARRRKPRRGTPLRP